ncbi:MAG: TRAP transporter small permease [Paracoccus sp. (in: a-proteobacteria)]|uniref:TRAP transporter small permease n=1 Tax=Paracoccus sp. TaxID=267 RepID=UPI0026E0B050|nr:TRAP transporter small permease [Paracoccus sp. (in: a-proteobacteria)]MDO5632747.1 TRAP transporter small permease [Paracoccus sp. (in: a-proteobacteria)]
MRVLDRLEETLIVVLMAAATLLIFVAVVQRYSLDILASTVRWSRGAEIEWLMQWSRSAFQTVRSVNMTWAQELCIYLFVWMAKFGAAYGVRMGIHVGVDVVVERLQDAARKWVTVIAMSGGILFTFIVTWIGTDFVWHVRQGGQISPDLEWPMWIIYLAVPLGSALMCFRFVQALYWYLTTGYIAHHDHGAVEGIEAEAKDLSKGGHA